MKANLTPSTPATTAPRQPPDAPLIDTRAAAQWLNIKPRTLIEFRYRGTGPKFVQVGSKLCRYRVADLVAWADANTRTSTLSARRGGEQS